MQSEKKDRKLLNRAYEIESWAEKHFVDNNGVIYSCIDRQTGNPITESFYTEDDNPFTVPGFTAAEFVNYENCGMTTGAYLQSQLYRYSVERNPDSLQKAQRCFNALKYIYNIGKNLEEGFFPKIYGNKFTGQTSTDQVLYATLAMDHYYLYADEKEKSEISRMITSMINFWVKRDYKFNYYTIKDMQWPLGRFTSLLLLAYKYSGDDKFKDEYDRLLAAGVNKFPVEEQLRPKIEKEVKPIPYEKKMNAWIVSHRADAFTMDVMEMDYLISNDKNNSWSKNWKQSIRQMWAEAKLTLSPDGKIYDPILVDMDTQQVRRPEPIFFTEEVGILDWIGFRYISGAKTGWSTMIARGGVQAYKHIEDKSMVPIILNILNSVDLNGLSYYEQPERFPLELRHKTRYYSGDAMANWLWAYWQARHDRVIVSSL